MMPIRTFQICLFPILLNVLIVGSTASGESPDAISRLNGAFRIAYAQARAETLARSGPIILASGDRLVLLHDGRREEGTIVHRNYHDLKTIAHVPLAVYTLLAPFAEGPIGADRIEQLRRLRQLTSEARAAVPQIFKDKRLARQQRRLLRKCLAFMDGRIDQQEYSRQELLSFLAPLMESIRGNIQAAVKLRIDNYHTQALAWRRTLKPEAWLRLTVVVQGAATPRKNNLAVQYFAKLLGERGEGRRIVYAESLFTDSQALKLVGTHLLDAQIGKDFFADSWRMHRDLLGTAAADYLEQLQFNSR